MAMECFMFFIINFGFLLLLLLLLSLFTLFSPYTLFFVSLFLFLFYLSIYLSIYLFIYLFIYLLFWWRGGGGGGPIRSPFYSTFISLSYKKHFTYIEPRVGFLCFILNVTRHSHTSQSFNQFGMPTVPSTQVCITPIKNS